MNFHKDISNNSSNLKDPSKIELNQNNFNIINKIYITPEKKPESEFQQYPNNFQNNNIMNINNKNNINKYNIINSSQNQSSGMNVEVFQTQKENQIINEILRNQFVRKVYGILLVQFIITFSLILICQVNVIKAFLFKQKALYISLMILSGITFILSFIIFICFPNFLKKVPQNYIFLFLFTISETILLVYISILYSFEYVLGAIVFLIGICFVIFFISCIKKISLRYILILVIITIFLGFIYGLLSIIFRNYYLEFLFCLIGAIVFTLILIYDTQQISQFDKSLLTIDDYIYAALILYTDIIRMFLQILRILGRFYNGKGSNNH
jgi:FtsH-binding integral membrane protein